MASRLNTIADAAVAIVIAALPVSDTTTVERTYLPEVLSPEYAEQITTRKVYVSGMSYSQVGVASRAEDLNEYVLRFLVVSRYTDPGAPTTAWVDSQIDWVEQYINDTLGDARGFRISDAWPETADVPVAWDAELLATENLFWSEIHIALRREDS